MPVPKSTVDNSPRKLLRDVVLEKMLAAIQDGTLQAGERLNDDELVSWLGVSRTPIREAIAKLVDYGLVEMEANRYTRVASPTREQFDDALQLYYGYAELAARWAVPRLDDAASKKALKLLDELARRAAAEDPKVFATLDELLRFFVANTGNALMGQLGESLIVRTQFVMLTEPQFMFWDAGSGIDTLAAAVRSKDGDAAGAVIRALGTALFAHLREVRTPA
ncbi:hypothetical protein GCM10009706_27950 [Curtobacterium citreum]|uniref:GntR family transcriptional regulator n=1 Tax=Curtobacterium citreum TaxID=2036 RepID=A0ABT2HKR5_9MICO|nr:MULTISPECIES: GntR family transcriptional regulator [Curtobacterium]MCS6523718.1 GntR family transcriptional regulator [Curtobacterium citreum]RDH95469.1 DNA-binding GntR family transcriptional regulator [Curtobacterium sp. AG1037]TQJ26489.1 DNA-binding GntR family transcriptional regulator [Curtobacterium citreum]GGL87739.1 hypothetical protein GCM10009706_27950 [Curtobacterium citreum]